MVCRTRSPDAGVVYHVLNRAVGRVTIFAKDADYAVFEKVLAEVTQKII
jgi:putative transposase